MKTISLVCDAIDKKLLDTSEDVWDQTIDTNLKGAFLFTKAVLPYMIQRNSGVIVNVNSGAGKTGFSDLSSAGYSEDEDEKLLLDEADKQLH